MTSCAILTRPSGAKLAVNRDHVRSVVPSDRGGCTLFFHGEDEIIIAESFDTAVAVIFDAAKSAEDLRS